MLDTIFLVTALVGGTVMVCQFILTLMGMGDDGGDFGDAADVGDVGDVGGDVGADAGGEFGGDVDGVDGDHTSTLSDAADLDVHHPNSSWLFGVVSFRTMVAALAFFGIAGKASLASDFHPMLALALATASGLIAMYAVYAIMQLFAKMSSSGNQRIRNALGRVASVYVAIPPSGEGAGKIQVSMQNRIVEYQAVTDETEKITSGDNVEVVGVVGADVVKVRRTEVASTS